MSYPSDDNNFDLTLSVNFDKACNYVERHTSEIDKNILLNLYGYFKQCNFGDCHDTQPSRIFKYESYKKYTAWNNCKGMSKSEAMAGYVNVLASAVPNWQQEITTSGGINTWVSVSTMMKEDDSEYNSDIFDCVKKGDIEKIKTVYDLDVSCKDENGLSLLHWASDRGHVDIVKYLLHSRKAEVNCIDNEKYTPLHLAASCGHSEICKILIEFGADIHAVNEDNEKPIDLAEDNNVIKILSNC